KVTEPVGYVLKPFEERELKTVVEIALYKHQAERLLRASERKYAAILASIGDGVIAADVTGQITLINPVAEALTGWSQREAGSRLLAEVFRIIDEATRLPVETPSQMVIREGRSVSLATHLLVAKSGREIPIDH